MLDRDAIARRVLVQHPKTKAGKINPDRNVFVDSDHVGAIKRAFAKDEWVFEALPGLKLSDRFSENGRTMRAKTLDELKYMAWCEFGPHEGESDS